MPQIRLLLPILLFFFPPPPEAIDAAIKRTGVLLPNSSLLRYRALAFYDSATKDCAGDSRAVLGRRGPNGKRTAAALSKDQTGGSRLR